MVPAVGRSRPTIIFAIVVLPEPDSPTMASEPPSGSENDTSSTATWLPKTLRSPRTSRTASAIDGNLHPSSQVPRPHAPGETAVELRQRGPRFAAGILQCGHRGANAH